MPHSVVDISIVHLKVNNLLFHAMHVWAKKKPDPVSVDAEHDKRIAENYVFDEVQGIYVSRAEHDRRARFNSDSYSPTKEEVRRFPSRPVKPTLPDIGHDCLPSISNLSKRKRNYPTFKS